MSHTSLGKAQHARRAGPRSAGSPLEPRTPDALALLIQSQSARPVAPAAGQLAAGLAVVHVARGATYRAPRVLVETIPPWLSAGARFLLAGTLLLGILGLRHGRGALRLTRRELISCAVAGLLLMTVAQGLVTVAVQDVPAGSAASVAAGAPLWVVVLRRVGGERAPLTTVVGVLLGFAGVALLLLPGHAESAPLPACCWSPSPPLDRPPSPTP